MPGPIRYITGSYNGIVLGQGDYGSPFTVGALAAIGLHASSTTSSATGISAEVAYAASVINYGYVYGSTDGIGLKDGGTVNNTELNGVRSNNDGQIYGAIYGRIDGVVLGVGNMVTKPGSGSLGGGTVTNDGGVIKGIRGDGILITGAAGSVYNSGVIRGDINDARTIGVGVYLEAGGAVTNGANGVIGGSDGGVIVTGGKGNLVANSGRIQGSHYGVCVEYGTVTNAKGGEIDADRLGVLLDQGSLVNNGLVDVDYSGEYQPSGAAAAQLMGGGYIDNGAGGSIYVDSRLQADGVLSEKGAATVENAGTISAYVAVALEDGGTVLNTGSIVGAGQYGVLMNLTHPVNADQPGSVLGYISNASTGTITGYVAVGAEGVGGSGRVSPPPTLSLVNSGTIYGTGAGLRLASTSASLTNAAGGTINGAGSTGIYLYKSDAAIGNAAGALISGGSIGGGIYAVLSNLTLINSGIIVDPPSDARDGVKALGTSYGGESYSVGAYIANHAGGTISGEDGVYLNVAIGSVVNDGYIAGADVGVSLQGGDLHLSNAASGTIAGGTIGVSADGRATLENAGTIIGTGGTAVYLGAIAGRVIVDAGASFSGTVEVKTGDDGTLELASGASTGTIHGLGAEYVGFGTVTIDNGASWTVAGNIAGFGGVTIEGFDDADRLDLTDLTFDSADTATLNGSNQLVITDPDGNITIGIDGGVGGQRFALSDDGDGGTFVEAPDIVGPNSTVSGLSALDGNSILISSGGVALGDSIGAGGFEIILGGGIASGTNIGKGGAATISSGGKSIAAVVSTGGTETVLTGGGAGGVTVKAGGVLIYGGGTITGATVSSGAGEIITKGVTVSGLAVGTGVNLTVSAGATVKATALSGGTDTILGIASGTTVLKAGTETVSAGGKSVGAIVSSGGAEKVLTGGTATAVAVKSGGILTISSGGALLGAVLSGAADAISGTASATTILTGGTETVSAGGKSIGAVVSSGGTDKVLTGGTVSTTTVKNGGTLVYGGGVVSGAIVSNGGKEVILTGITVSSLSVGSGATLTISSGGTASKPTVLAGGIITDLGHTVSATAKGTETVSAKGIASATTVDTGGVLIVSSGGTAIGTVLSGGIETVLSGGVISGAVSFKATGDRLSITGTKPAALTVSGFVKTDTIDLASFASKIAKLSFVEDKAKTSGTLFITDGALKASVTLFGNYVATGFKLAADGTGTAVTYTSATGAHEGMAVTHT